MRDKKNKQRQPKGRYRQSERKTERNEKIERRGSRCRDDKLYKKKNYGSHATLLNFPLIHCNIGEVNIEKRVNFQQERIPTLFA